MHGVVDAVLALLDLDFRRAADADDAHAARELRETLLQLLAVVVRGGLLDLRLDLLDAASISVLEPAPFTMVVFSFSITTFLARPSMLRVTFSSLMPRSSEIAVPPVRIAMSCSMALRRSPKPGAFTAAIFRPPRSLLTTSVASASPSRPRR
jgi:hypothetical protein